MQSEIANQLRAECARILARHYGGIPDAIAAIRVSTVQRIAEYVEHAEARTCRCQDQRGFEIDTRRAETPAYAAMRQAGVDRMLERAGLLAAEDKRVGVV